MGGGNGGNGGNGGSDRMLLRTPEHQNNASPSAVAGSSSGASAAKEIAINASQRKNAPDPNLNPIPSVPHDWTWSTF